MTEWRDWALLAARVLIAVLFVGGAVQKAIDPVPAMAMLGDMRLPGWLVWPALVFDTAVGAALLAGWRITPVALAAAAYCAATSFFHLIQWDPWQTTIFVKNWSIAGGALALAAAGGGRFGMDGRGTAKSARQQRP